MGRIPFSARDVYPRLRRRGLEHCHHLLDRARLPHQELDMMETSIGAVARVRAFVRDTEPEFPTPAPAMPPPGWPSAGAIEFRDVRATYR